MFGYQNCSGGFIALKGEEISQGSMSEAPQFSCTDPNATAILPAIVLSKKQYENTLAALFGASILQSAQAELTTFLADSNDPDTHRRTTELTAQRIEAYETIARAVAAVVVADATMRGKVFGACASLATPGATCIDGYLDGFAKRILRRPLTSDEKLVAKTIANSGGDYATNLRAVLALHLQSPFFTWRLELGESAIAASGEVVLSPYEIASRISYETADVPPDAALMTAADKGELSDLANVKTHVARLLHTPQGREKVQNNLMRWSLSDRVANVGALPDGLKQDVSTTGLDEAILNETRAYIDHLVFDLRGSYAELLTSRLSFASHAGLAKIHGHAPVSGAPAQVGGRRQGLLMRSAFASGSSPRTSIIGRGVEFQKHILCNKIPSPTADVVDLRDQEVFTHDELLNKTNREAVTHQTKSPVCMGCHSVINPTGFAFESLDPLGRPRTSEAIFDGTTLVRSLPIDASAIVPLGGGQVAPVQDAFDLVSVVAYSPRASACFTRNVFRYIHEKEETQADSCRLAGIHAQVSNPDKPLVDALVEAIATRAIFVKKVQ